MNNEEIEAIRERAKKATTGPWLYSEGVYVVTNVVGDGMEWSADYIAEADCSDDADFIAHAREDIPKLLAEIERLRRGIEIVIKETHCDDTWDYLNRLIDGKAFTELSYRIGGDNE